jgi:rhodanese-related sulfurtransferase
MSLHIHAIRSHGKNSFAAAALQDIGLWRETDIAFGFHAWRGAGLPTLEIDAAAGSE